MRATIPAAVLLLIPVVFPVAASDPAPAALDRPFRDAVRPFLQTYCLDCHGPPKPKGDLDLSAYPSVEAVAKDLRRWEAVLEQLQAGAMPPEKAKRHPTAEQRQGVIGWVRALRRH